MSANLRCYNNGKLTFSLDDHTTRFLGVLPIGISQGIITIDISGGTPFYLIASSDDWTHSQSFAWTNTSEQVNSQNLINVQFVGNEVRFQKPQNCLIYIGVYQ